MKRTILTLLTGALAYSLMACATTTTPAANSTANANAATTKPAAAAPTADALMALDKNATEAYWKGDGKAFETILSDKFTWPGNKGTGDKANSIKMISAVKCDVKSSQLSEPQSLKIDDDTYVVSYKGTADGMCNDGPNGAMKKIASPFRGNTVWVRNGDRWQAAFHNENPIVDMSNPPKSGDVKPTDAKTDAKPNVAKGAPAPTAAKSANTDAVVAAEKAGWVAWMNHDAKALDAFLAKNAAISNSDGSFMNDRAAIVKYWAEMPCKDVKTVDVKDAFGITLGPNAEMITFSGVSDGTCFGQKNVPMPSMSIYVKEDGGWKLAFGTSTPPEG